MTEQACAELAQLTPMLAPALRRDVTRAATWTLNVGNALSLYNPDVLAVMITLRHEIPAAAMRCCQLTGEPFPQNRPFGTYLTAIPRWHERIHALRKATGARKNRDGSLAACCYLDDLTASWVRQAKRALGLRTPDLALGNPDGTAVTCPECLLGDPPYGHLYMAGSEGFIKPGPVIEWHTSGRVYCRECGASWPEAEWQLLLRILATSRQHAQGPTSLPEHAPDVAC
jgi:hypothetical protein